MNGQSFPPLQSTCSVINPPRIWQLLIQNNTYIDLALYFLSMPSHSENLDVQPSLFHPAVPPPLQPQRPHLAQVLSEAVTLCKAFTTWNYTCCQQRHLSILLSGHLIRTCVKELHSSHLFKSPWLNAEQPAYKQLISPCCIHICKALRVPGMQRCWCFQQGNALTPQDTALLCHCCSNIRDSCKISYFSCSSCYANCLFHFREF